MKLALVDGMTQRPIHLEPIEFHQRLKAKVASKLPGIFIHTRREVLQAIEDAYQELVTEVRQESIHH
jgi:hypothetical protein